jgi:hypothetical protein
LVAFPTAKFTSFVVPRENVMIVVETFAWRHALEIKS